MSKKPSIQITEREAEFIAKLRECPDLHEQLDAIVKLAGNHAAPGKADEVEEKLIDLFQQLGQRALGNWATKREEQTVQERRSQGSKMQQREKKDCTGGASSDGLK